MNQVVCTGQIGGQEAESIPQRERDVGDTNSLHGAYDRSTSYPSK
jgi:hypothetical protein